VGRSANAEIPVFVSSAPECVFSEIRDDGNDRDTYPFSAARLGPGVRAAAAESEVTTPNTEFGGRRSLDC
jgi:hypothetical protein